MSDTKKKYFEPIVIFGLILSVVLNLFVIFQYVIVTSETSKHNEKEVKEIKQILKDKVSVDSFFDYNQNIKDLVNAVRADNKDDFDKIIARIERLEDKWISKARSGAIIRNGEVVANK